MTLAEILHDSWERLEAGASDPDHPCRLAVLGTSDRGHCRLRTVILRSLDRGLRQFCFFTDRRTPKVSQILANPNVSALFFDSLARVQLRIDGAADIHLVGAFFEECWSSLPDSSRCNFLATLPPGERADSPVSSIPDFLVGREPTLVETEKGKRNFAVIRVECLSMDWLLLQPQGNLRAFFRWSPSGELDATWLAP